MSVKISWSPVSFLLNKLAGSVSSRFPVFWDQERDVVEITSRMASDFLPLTECEGVVYLERPEARSSLLLSLVECLREQSARNFISSSITCAVCVVFKDCNIFSSSLVRFYLVLEGKGQVTIDNMDKDVGASTSFSVPPQCCVSIKTSGRLLLVMFTLEPMSLQDRLHALVRRAMHHYPVLRTPLPYYIENGKVVYRSDLELEIKEILPILKDEDAVFNKSLRS